LQGQRNKLFRAGFDRNLLTATTDVARRFPDIYRITGFLAVNGEPGFVLPIDSTGKKGLVFEYARSFARDIDKSKQRITCHV
jgi:hypothetical protein